MEILQRVRQSLSSYDSTKWLLLIDGLPVKYSIGKENNSDDKSKSITRNLYIDKSGVLTYSKNSKSIEVDYPDLVLLNAIEKSLPFCDLIGFDSANCNLVAFGDLHIFCIYTDKYNYCMRLLENPGQIFSIGNNTSITRADVNRLLVNFKDHILKVHKELIYRKNSVFMHRIKKCPKIYKTANVFVPVFIEGPIVPSLISVFPFLENTNLYRIASSKNRIVSNNGVTCYMLTNLEICKAFALQRMLRFQPMDIYNLLVVCGHLLNNTGDDSQRYVESFLEAQSIRTSKFLFETRLPFDEKDELTPGRVYSTLKYIQLY